MIFSMNIHPDKKWVKVEALHYGRDGGCCIILRFTDESGKTASPDIHYGSPEDANEFIGMLQEAVNSLLKTCGSCGQKLGA